MHMRHHRADAAFGDRRFVMHGDHDAHAHTNKGSIIAVMRGQWWFLE